MKIFLNYFSQSLIQKILILIAMAFFITLTHASDCESDCLCTKDQVRKNQNRMPANQELKANLNTQRNSFQVLSYDYNADGLPEIVKAE